MRIDLEDAMTIFDRPVLEVRSDHGAEVRWKALGEIDGLVIAVVYTLRRERRRIISARRAGEYEREAYRATGRGAAEG